MNENINLIITDFYCNGFAGRRYDLVGSIIEAEGKDWIIIRTVEDEPVFLNLQGYEKQSYINNWTK
jgi:hypothetical protein